MNNQNITRICLFSAIVAIVGMIVPVQASTVAYWRFEEGPAGAAVPHGGLANGVFYPGTADSSGNGNALSVWAEGWAGYVYRDLRAYTTVPQTGVPNNFSVKNSGVYPAMFTNSVAMRTMTPAQWTIEATFKLESGNYKTIVGRDSRGTATTNADLAALYFQSMPDQRLAIKYCDVAGVWHEALSANNVWTGFTFSTDPDGANAPWYSMAAVSNGQTLTLYLFNHNNPTAGYQQIAQTVLTGTSSNLALTAGAGSGGDWTAGNWTVGRGLYAGGHGDRAFGFIDEVRISDSALPVSMFLASTPIVSAVFPKQDEILEIPDAITYEWDAMIPGGVNFTSYKVYIADNAADLAPAVPTATLHTSAAIPNVATTTYAGYSGTYTYSEDYYWRVDVAVMEPNYADPNNTYYNIPAVYQGTPIRFYGPRACAGLTISGNVSNVPDPVTQIYTPQDAVFTVDINRGLINNADISWYKVVGVQDSLPTLDPNDTADSIIPHSAGDMEIAFNASMPAATQTTLTVVGAAPSDNGSYYARVQLVDPMGGSTGCTTNSPTASLFVRDAANAANNYLVHRYGFDGNVNDSIGIAHGTVVDAGDPNYTYADGQIVFNNGSLSSRPTEAVSFPAPTPEDPNATITRQLLLEQPGAYVDLPNGIISPLGKCATFMAWFTYNSADTGNWPRIFDMGTSTGGEGFSTGGDGVMYIGEIPYLDTSAADTYEYVMLSPKRDAGPGWRYESVVRPPSYGVATDPADNSALAGGVQACVACVFDAVNGVQILYVNGVEVARSTGLSNFDLSNITDVNNWLGRSQWPDAMFSGKINEFRIYDIALSSYWVKAYSDQGPDNYGKPNPCIQDTPNAMDFNDDCAVDIQDFAAFAGQWLSCDRLYGCD